jgi:hypothetical protein
MEDTPLQPRSSTNALTQYDWLDKYIGINDVLLVEVLERRNQQKVFCKIIQCYSHLYNEFCNYESGFIEFVYTGNTYGYPALDIGQTALVPLRLIPGSGLYENFHPRHFLIDSNNQNQTAIWYGTILSNDSYFPQEVRMVAKPWSQKTLFTALPFTLLESLIKSAIPIIHSRNKSLYLMELAKLRTERS